MEIVDKERFDDAENLPPVKRPHDLETGEVMNEQKFDLLLKAMENPVEAQKEIAAKIKSYLDHRINKELEEKGYLSDHTRRWVKDYNVILEAVHKALYGDKSLHLHKVIVSHGDIASKMRKYKKVKEVDETDDSNSEIKKS